MRLCLEIGRVATRKSDMPFTSEAVNLNPDAAIPKPPFLADAYGQHPSLR